MEKESKAKILELLAAHRIMTVATVRPDGWPQATTVGFVNDGLVLYFLCARDSQKAVNISHDDRVSLTIDHDTTKPMAITGLSMAARAKAMSIVEGAMWEARHRPMAIRANAMSEAEEVAKALSIARCAIPRICRSAAPAGRLPHDLRHARRAGSHFDPRLLERLRPHRARHCRPQRSPARMPEGGDD